MTELFNDIIASVLGCFVFILLVALGAIFWKPLMFLSVISMFVFLFYKRTHVVESDVSPYPQN